MLNELNKLIPFFKNSKREIIFSEPNIGLSEIKAVKKVLKSKFLSSGEQVELFESEFSSYNSVPFSVAVNSGTSALHLSLLALGVGPGDEVIVPAFTFAATANAVSLTGAKPIFCDIENDYYCIEPKQIENLISVKTKAIIPVHLFGHPSDMLSIKALATKHNCYVIEDAAQAHGASIAGKMAGSWGDVGCFSFYPTKNMTSGEGGMVTTHSYGLVRKIKLLRNQGMDKKYENEIIGFNNRMTDIHAAIGRVQLSKLASMNKLRAWIADFYNSNLENVITPRVANNAVHAYHQYTIRLLDHNRDKFASELSKLGIPTGVYYPKIVPKLDAFRNDESFPIAESLTKNCLSIPINPKLSRFQVDKITSAINKIARAGI